MRHRDSLSRPIESRPMASPPRIAYKYLPVMCRDGKERKLPYHIYNFLQSHDFVVGDVLEYLRPLDDGMSLRDVREAVFCLFMRQAEYPRFRVERSRDDVLIVRQKGTNPPPLRGAAGHDPELVGLLRQTGGRAAKYQWDKLPVGGFFLFGPEVKRNSLASSFRQWADSRGFYRAKLKFERFPNGGHKVWRTDHLTQAQIHSINQAAEAARQAREAQQLALRTARDESGITADPRALLAAAVTERETT